MARILNINSINIVGIDSVVVKDMNRRFLYTYEDTDLGKTIPSRGFVDLLEGDSLSEALSKAAVVANNDLI